jgi:hypothetical protein
VELVFAVEPPMPASVSVVVGVFDDEQLASKTDKNPSKTELAEHM